jgi:hypothetical protein
MFEILKSLLAGTPFEGLLKLLGGLFGSSETVDNQSNTNENQSAQLPTDSPLPPNEPTQQGNTTANGDFDFDQILKKVEEILGGSSQNQSSESENGEIESPTEPEMEPDEPVAQPKQPKTQPKVEPTVPTSPNAPEPISASAPEARPMPSAKELEEESLGLEKESNNNLVSDEESLGFEPETEITKRLDPNSKKTTDEESLGFEKQ